MGPDTQFLSPVRIGRPGAAPPVARHEDPSAQELLRDLRDMLFVIAGATAHLLPGAGPSVAPVLGQIAGAARQASDHARALADLMHAPADGGTVMSFDANARLRGLRRSLEARLPAGSELRLRLAAGLWHARGDAACFDSAVSTLLASAADAMRRRGLAAPVAILTSNRPSAPPNGQVRVSIVSDAPWFADGDLCPLRDAESALARCGGELKRSGAPGSRAAAHIDLRRA